MNKYLEKLAELEKEALRASVREIIKRRAQFGHGSPEELKLVDSLRAKGAIKSPETYALGMHKGNEKLISKMKDHPQNIQEQVFDKITGPWSEAANSINKKIQGNKFLPRIAKKYSDRVAAKIQEHHDIGLPQQTRGNSIISAKTYNPASGKAEKPIRGINTNLTHRHEIHEARVAQSPHIENRMQQLGERMMNVQGEAHKSFRTLVEKPSIENLKKLKGPVKEMVEVGNDLQNIGYGNITNRGKLVGKHYSTNVLARESNDVRTNPYSNVGGEGPFIMGAKETTLPSIRLRTGENKLLRNMSGSRYGIDRMGKTQMKRLMKEEVRRGGKLEVDG